MIGDQAPPVSVLHSAAVATPPATPGGKNPISTPSVLTKTQVTTSVRGFKIAENQSPVPQDRVFFSFNYFDNVNNQLNKVFQAPIKGVEIYRYTLGFEKTFNGGYGSIGLRLPIDNVFARSKAVNVQGGGNSTATGNLTIFAKHIFYVNRETGSVATGGVAISPMTAPGTFGGAKFLAASNTTTFQPFFAFLINRPKFYFQGFTAIDTPVDPSQPTLVYNDFGVGYYAYRNNAFDTLITAVAPTVEVHINTPINHSGAYNPKDTNGTPDIINITTGLNTRFRTSSILTMGVVVPVTGPRPFSIEGTVLFNYYFGRSRPKPSAPIIGN